MKKIKNSTHIEGRVYQHKLEKRVSGEQSKHPGTEFISGSIDIATDEACTNIVTVHFPYVTPAFSSGKANPNYVFFANLIDGNIKTVMKEGAESAEKIAIDSAIGVNDFYTLRNNSDEYELVSAKRNEGGFVHPVASLNPDEGRRSTFDCDMLIVGTREIIAENDADSRVYVKGYTFDFRNALLPVEFAVSNPNAMDYFLGLGATEKEPVFTEIQGRQVSTVVKKEVVKESAFGEDIVDETTSSRKEFLITWAAKEPYVCYDESSITEEEMNKLVADRETYLAARKQNAIDYANSKKNPAATVTVANSAFNF